MDTIAIVTRFLTDLFTVWSPLLSVIGAVYLAVTLPKTVRTARSNAQIRRARRARLDAAPLAPVLDMTTRIAQRHGTHTA